jgi:hypothetical protein
VRRQYEEGHGVPCLVAVEQDASGNALKLALAYGHGIGGARAGVIETTFAEETETDLFGEQAVLCGGLTELMVAGFETLVKAGYQPEVAYYECMHELKLIVDLLHEGGLRKMHEFISETAAYGDLTRGPRIVDDHVRETMQKVLTEIQDGTFAREWIEEYAAGQSEYKRMMNDDLAHQIEKVGGDLRSRGLQDENPMKKETADKRITIFDTTLRDGEQAPGCSMTLREKLRVARALADLRVDVIEAGFPAASPGDFDSVKAIADENLGPTICGLARCNREDIEKVHAAVKGADKHRIHVFVATSEIHREHKLKMAKEEILKSAAGAVTILRKSSLPQSRPAQVRSTSRTPSATRCRASSTNCSGISESTSPASMTLC